MTVIELDTLRVLVLSIVVLWVGGYITSHVGFLRRFSIPIAVTGGLACSLVLTGLEGFADIDVALDLSLRDVLLLTFFSTIGLSAKLRLLVRGGRLLAILGLATIAFLVLQNAVGTAIVAAAGEPPARGLLAGSVSLAGGHGTAITWGQVAIDAGFPRGLSLGLAFATFGLICGGLVGGPIAEYLIERHELAPNEPHADPPGKDAPPASDPDDEAISVTPRRVIVTLLCIAICIGVGAELNRWIDERGIVLPGFLTAMATGIVLTNVADLRRRPLDENEITLFNQVSLHLFLAMSLMALDLMELAGVFGPILVLLAAQVALAVAFAIFVVSRVCGRDYEAAVMAAGYAGLGLGATPVGVANMNAVTSHFGPAPAAFLVIPLVGAFLLDIVNAVVIQLYLELLT